MKVKCENGNVYHVMAKLDSDGELEIEIENDADDQPVSDEIYAEIYDGHFSDLYQEACEREADRMEARIESMREDGRLFK